MLCKFKSIILWTTSYVSFLLCVHFIAPYIDNPSLECLTIISIITIISLAVNYLIKWFDSDYSSDHFIQ